MNLDNLVGERHHAPDILDCLANLSSDEVFTPPHIAQKMLDLLPDEVWTNPDLKFLDPVCKTGVFLRECAARLMVGLKDIFVDENERREHIFRNMLFGLSITELTGHIARRSVYYSKDATSSNSVVQFASIEGNIPYIKCSHSFEDRVRHEPDNQRCSICGAPQALERGSNLENYAYSFIHEAKIFDMKFDVIVGNPPYQLDDDGFGASASPLYHLFVEKAISYGARYISFIIPARWYAGGKGLNDFRETMINDRHIRYLIDYPNAEECFSGVSIKGGVCIFLRDSHYTGDCEVVNIIAGVETSRRRRDLRETGDVLVRSNGAISILHKVRGKQELTFDSSVSRQKPFGLRTNFQDFVDQPKPGFLKLYLRGGIGYIPKSYVTVNVDWIPYWKVVTPMACDGSGKVPMRVTAAPIVIGPGEVVTETYLVVGIYKTEAEAIYCSKYILTKFVRFMISMRKNTQHLTSDRFSFVPLIPMNQLWTDKMLYEKYELTVDEIDHIESTILEMSI